MSRSLNKVTLIGNLGADPEIRSTTGGNRVATFSLATSRSWNNQSGDRQEKTEWHRCVVWNTKGSQLADIVDHLPTILSPSRTINAPIFLVDIVRTHSVTKVFGPTD